MGTGLVVLVDCCWLLFLEPRPPAGAADDRLGLVLLAFLLVESIVLLPLLVVLLLLAGALVAPPPPAAPRPRPRPRPPGLRPPRPVAPRPSVEDMLIFLLVMGLLSSTSCTGLFHHVGKLELIAVRTAARLLLQNG